MLCRPRLEKRSAMDTRKLAYFVKIVDSGSITKAAAALHVAQPALSQQVSALETDLKQRLLIRSKQGVEPTAAGHTLYRHAQTILRQVEQARIDVAASGAAPSGRVSIAIAPYSMASSLTPQIISEVGRRYPDIVLHVTEIYGGVLSEAIKNGRLDMALIYEPGPIRGVQFTTLIVEDLYLVVNAARELPVDPGAGTIALEAAATLGLFLPERIHTLRQVVEEDFRVLRITGPALQCKIALCTPDHEPLSEAGSAVLLVLKEMLQEMLRSKYQPLSSGTPSAAADAS